MSRAKLAGVLAAAAALSLALGACANNGSSGGGSSASGGVDLPIVSQVPVPADAAKPEGDGNATCSGVTLAYAGAETGPNAQLGVNILNGVQLAIDQHNKANKNCQVNLKKFDTEGAPDKATGVVTQVASEKDIIGVVGLPFSGESKATGAIFEQAGLPHITPSATNADLTKNGWKTLFRGLTPDSVQGQAVASFMTDKLKANKVCVIADDSEYGNKLGDVANQALGSKSDPSCKNNVTTGQRDFSAVISKIMTAKPDAVFYSGYYSEAAPLDQQLVNKGYNGKFVGPDGSKDDQFIKQAGSASANAYFTCPCQDGSLIPSFANAYKQVSGGAEPGTYSLEGYDSATVMLKAIDSKITDRAGMLNYVKNYNGNGLGKHMQWDATGELTSKAVYGYKVADGKIAYVGPIS